MATATSDPKSDDPAGPEPLAVDPGTGVPDRYAQQDAKTCQPECDCRCQWVEHAPACRDCGGPGEVAVVSADAAPPTHTIQARIETVRNEADERAHDRVAPDATLDSIAPVNLYAEAFLAGAKRVLGDGRSAS